MMDLVCRDMRINILSVLLDTYTIKWVNTGKFFQANDWKRNVLTNIQISVLFYAPFFGGNYGRRRYRLQL